MPAVVDCAVAATNEKRVNPRVRVKTFIALHITALPPSF
jgi:hypothetical protein